MRLDGKVAIVTASTRGIGLACTQRLAREGAIVYMAARNMERAENRAKELNDEGCNVKTVYNDATEKETYTSMVEEVFKNEGRIDILVNNFGTSNPQKDLDIKNTEYDEYIRTVDINLASVFMTSQAAIPHMAANGGGSIINISSIGGLRPDISQIAYGTSKAAINYLTKLIATQCARDNIRCNAVLPGMTATEAVSNNLTPEFQEFFLKHIPIKSNQIMTLGYDYVAFGHIHKPQLLVENRMAYAGSLEPTDTGDIGRHGYIEGRITGKGCQIRFVPHALREYRNCEVKVDKSVTGHVLRQKITDMIAEQGMQHMYKITLTGYRDPDIWYELDHMDPYGNVVEITDHTKPAYDFTKLKNENKGNILGQYIESLEGYPADSLEYQALCEGVRALMETRRG